MTILTKMIHHFFFADNKKSQASVSGKSSFFVVVFFLPILSISKQSSLDTRAVVTKNKASVYCLAGMLNVLNAAGVKEGEQDRVGVVHERLGQCFGCNTAGCFVPLLAHSSQVQESTRVIENLLQSCPGSCLLAAVAPQVLHQRQKYLW